MGVRHKMLALDGILNALFDLVRRCQAFEPNNCTVQKCHHLAA
jgi:hypothetical protein